MLILSAVKLWIGVLSALQSYHMRMNVTFSLEQGMPKLCNRESAFGDKIWVSLEAMIRLHPSGEKDAFEVNPVEGNISVS